MGDNYFQRNKIIIVNIFNVIAILEPHKTPDTPATTLAVALPTTTPIN